MRHWLGESQDVEGIEEYNKGKVYKMNDGEHMSGFLGRMLCEE